MTDEPKTAYERSTGTMTVYQPIWRRKGEDWRLIRWEDNPAAKLKEGFPYPKFGGHLAAMAGCVSQYQATGIAIQWMCQAEALGESIEVGTRILRLRYQWETEDPQDIGLYDPEEGPE